MVDEPFSFERQQFRVSGACTNKIYHVILLSAESAGL